MGPHLHNLIHQSWQAFLQAEGTTGLGWIGDKIVLPIGAFVFAVIAIWRIQGREAVKDHKGRTFGLAFVASVAVFIIWHLSIFGWVTVRSVYLDHQDSTGRWRAVVNEKDSVKVLLKQRDEYIKQLKQDLDLKPRTVEKTKFIPEPQRCWMEDIDQDPSPYVKDARSATTVVIYCNYKIDAPYDVYVQFNGDFLGGSVTSDGGVEQAGLGKQPGNAFSTEIISPSLPAYQLVRVLVQSSSKTAPYAIKGTIKSK